MEFKVEELEGVRRKLDIEIPGNVVAQRVDRAYKEINKQVKMPGFRSGKIPQDVLEKQVPLESMSELWQGLMQEYYDKALMETGMVPAGPPEIDHSAINEIKKDKPFSFSVVLDIKPEIKYKNYKGLKFKKTLFKVTDAEVEVSVQNHLKPFGTFEIFREGHEVQLGDHLVMDFEGYLGGELLENGVAKDYPVVVGERKMIAGFEDQLLGQKANEEFEVKVTLPVDWNNKIRRVSMPIPGAPEQEADDLATFHVRIKEIKKLNLPELTDEFVQQQGEESVESFRRRVKTGIQSMKEYSEEVRIKQDIFNYLVKEHDIEVPESLIKQELKFMIEGMKFQIQQSGMKLEDSGFNPEQAEQEWRPRALFNAKGYIILEGIAREENLHVAQSDMEAEYKRLADETKKSVEEVKQSLFSNQDYMTQTSNRILGQKALNLIFSHCEYEFLSEEDMKVELEKRERENAHLK
ncbi:MAG: trigger factor [Nitrospinota bacterium]|jgi:trigger factor|nr:trigger factor [Nitrospinota bacterium]